MEQKILKTQAGRSKRNLINSQTTTPDNTYGRKHVPDRFCKLCNQCELSGERVNCRGRVKA